jgi:membrane protease YdiL (CAAX protease family)
MFTLRLTLSLLIAALAAAFITPLIAPLIASAGFHFPFPRIFDRVVMVAALLALLWENRDLRLLGRLQTGFAQPLSYLLAAIFGLIIGAAAIAILWGLAWLMATPAARVATPPLILTVATNIIPALVIAITEEAFFRAFLLSGLAEDFGRVSALAISSAIYAAAHLVRSPARFEDRTFHPLLGLQNLAASLGELGHPGAMPGLLGLFLLGLLLGLAFLGSGRVYFSIGLHASVIMGAKTWRRVAPGAQSAPGWLSGYGRPPLVSGPAAWAITAALLIVTAAYYALSRSTAENVDSLNTSIGQGKLRGRDQS